MLGFAHHENLVGGNDYGDLVEPDVPPVTVNLLQANTNEEDIEEGLRDDVSGTGRSRFIAFSEKKSAAPKYALRQIFNDSTSKIISQGKIDPYQKPIARNLLLPSDVDKQEKRFEDLFLRHKSQYDGLNVYKQTRNDYEQFEKLDSSPLRHHQGLVLPTNKRNSGRKQEADNRELKDAAALDEKIETLKGQILMKHIKKNHKDHSRDGDSSKQDNDDGWVGKTYSKLKNGNTLKDDLEAKKKLYQKLKAQVLFNSDSRNDNDKEDSGNLSESEIKFATKPEESEDGNENEKSSEDEFQQFQQQQDTAPSEDSDENELSSNSQTILAPDQKFLRKSDDDINFPTAEEKQKNNEDEEKEDDDQNKLSNLSKSHKNLQNSPKKKLASSSSSARIIYLQKLKSKENNEQDLAKMQKEKDKSDDDVGNENNENGDDDAKTTEADLEVKPKPKKPGDRLPPPTATEIKPKPPKKSPIKPEDLELKPLPTARKPGDLKPGKPEDLKPGNPLEDKYRPNGAAALKPQTMLTTSLLFSYDDGAEDGEDLILVRYGGIEIFCFNMSHCLIFFYINLISKLIIL